MQIPNLKNKLKSVGVLITTVIAYNLGDKILNYRQNLLEQKAQEVRDAQTQMNTDTLNTSTDTLKIINDKLTNNLKFIDITYPFIG